jgi:hypothetical protein
MSALLRLVFQLLFALALLNFMLFLVSDALLNGNAAQGMVRNGHYYLAMRSQLTEVSRPVFLYSQWVTSSLLLTIPLGMVSAFLLRQENGGRSVREWLLDALRGRA